MLQHSSRIMNVINNFIVLQAVYNVLLSSVLRFAKDFDKVHVTMIG